MPGMIFAEKSELAGVTGALVPAKVRCELLSAVAANNTTTVN